MSDLRQYAKAVWVYAIHHALEKEGHDSQTMFSANNVDFSSLKSVHENIPRETINKLWLSAVKLSGNDAFCLKTLDFINEPFINALVSVTRACPTIGKALELLQKFHTLISPELRLSVDIDEQLKIRVWNVEGLGDWLPEDRDITLAIIAKHGFAIAAKEIKPLSLQLVRPEPLNSQDYQAQFNCAIEWGAEENCLVYPIEVLQLNIPSANTHMHGHFEHYLEQSLEQQQLKNSAEQLKDKVESYLLTQLGPQFPTLTQTAQHFHMSTSTFKKHLHAEGTHYQQITDEIRALHAQKLILKSKLSFKEIAYQLGFANSSAFNKAFRRWTGLGPGEFAKSKRSTSSIKTKETFVAETATSI